MSALRGLRSAAIALLLAATTGVTLAEPASAAPPVAVDDHRSMWAGQSRLFDVLQNDSDPDGAEDLTICRVTKPDEDVAYVEILDDKLYVWAAEGRTRDIAITYYACDYETLVPATLTISLRPLVRPKVVKLDRPGRLRVTNDNNRAIRFLWGSFEEDRPDGRVWVEAHDAVVIRVHRRRIDWVAIIARTVVAGIGHVRGIELPSRSRASDRAPVDLSRAEAEVWTAR